MFEKKWQVRIQDMIDSINRVFEVTEDYSYEQFIDDVNVTDITERHFITIGEAACKVPKDIQKKYYDIKWREVMGMRHVVVHDYDEVDFEVIWDVVDLHLYDLKQKLQKILEENTV